mmetsp:Transcript_22389/g.54682  ORF Transcript_22389/g.54682 Transcript_22389/m.54682 type:complete len:93 (+) Transcript_22389:1040-1318(+)
MIKNKTPAPAAVTPDNSHISFEATATNDSVKIDGAPFIAAAPIAAVTARAKKPYGLMVSKLLIDFIRWSNLEKFQLPLARAKRLRAATVLNA